MRISYLANWAWKNRIVDENIENFQKELTIRAIFFTRSSNSTSELFNPMKKMAPFLLGLLYVCSVYLSVDLMFIFR